MNTASERFRRLTLLLPRFAAEAKQSLSALAVELAVSEAVILADLQALIERYDDPAGYQDPVGVLIEHDTVTVRTDHFLRPMRVTVAELCALELGLGVLEHEVGAVRTADLASLRAKLARCITALPDDAAYAGLRHGAMAALPGGSDGVLELLRRALRRSRVVEIGYQRPQDAAADSRVVRPYRLFFHHGAWYLAGWCERAGDLRLYRTDRIMSVVVMDQAHEVPADFSLESIMVGGRPFAGPAASVKMEVCYSPAIARWIAERDGLPLEADGSALRSMPLADREWAVRHVLQYGPDAVVVAPDDLRVEVVARLGEMQ